MAFLMNNGLAIDKNIPDVIDPDTINSFIPKINTQNLEPPAKSPVVNLPKIEIKTPIPAVNQAIKILETIAKDNNSAKINNELNTEFHNKDQNDQPLEIKKEMYIFSDWVGSLMFDDGDLQALNKAIVNSSNTIDRVELPFVKQSKPLATSLLDLAAKIDVSPSFYLDSIIYKDERDWALWVNKKKITPGKIKDLKVMITGLEILDVNRAEVTFKWNTHYLDQVSPGWANKLTNDGSENEDFFSVNKDIIVKADNSGIIFKLQQNQTFVVLNMAIQEGYVPDQPLNTAEPNTSLINEHIIGK